MDSEHRENIIKVADDLMNFSLDSLVMGRAGRGGDNVDGQGAGDIATAEEKQEEAPQAEPVGQGKNDEHYLEESHMDMTFESLPNKSLGPALTVGGSVDSERLATLSSEGSNDNSSDDSLKDDDVLSVKTKTDHPSDNSVVSEQVKEQKSEEAEETGKQVEDSQEECNQPQKDFAHMSFQTAIGHNSDLNDNEEAEENLIETNLINKTTKIDQKELEIEDKEEEEEENSETKGKMEFTKNYSDDLLMGQSEGNQGTGGVDLADFELPPYSGSSSGSEPRQQSPIKRKSSSSSSSTAQPCSSQQQSSSSVGLRGLKDLLVTSYSNTSHVLQWKKPIETGIYFGIGVTLITAFTFFSIISVVAYSALGVIMTSGLIKVYKSVMQTLNKSPETPFDHVWEKVLSMNVTISQEKVHEFINSSLGNINSSLVYFKQVLLFEDKIATLKFGFYFYLLTYIGSWFNGMTLITLCYLGMFSLPIAYEKNKTQVDQYFNLIQGHICSTTNKVSSLVFGNSKSASGSKKQN